jgi:hypothetical protein
LTINISSIVVLTTLPPYFDRTKSKWDDFAELLSTYIAAYDTDLDTDKKKVFFTISFL